MNFITKKEVLQTESFAMEVIGCIIGFSPSKCGKYMFTTEYYEFSGKYRTTHNSTQLWDLEKARAYWEGQIEAYGYTRIK